MRKHPYQKCNEFMMRVFLQNLKPTKNNSLGEGKNLDLYVQT